VANPVDVAGATDTDPTRFAAAAEALFADPAVGLVLVVGLFGGYHLRFNAELEVAEDTTAAELAALAARHRLPLLVQSCYAVDQPANHDVLRAAGVPVLGSIDHAVRAAAALHRRGRRLATVTERSLLRLPEPVAGRPVAGRPDAGRPVAGRPDTGRLHGHRVLDEPDARRLVESAGLDTGRWLLASTPEEAVAAVSELGGRCALKVVSRQVLHKSDAGGVRLGVTEDSAAQAWAGVLASVAARLPEARVDGMVVAPMAPPGVELLVGATQDPDFGPVVAFGSGGVLVEALRDVTFRAAPFSHLEAQEMISETVADRMLDGYRHLPAVDRDALAGFLVLVGDLVAAHPEVDELDLNPVIASGAQVLPVDVRAVLR